MLPSCPGLDSYDVSASCGFCRLYDEDPEEAMKMCKHLLQEEMLELGVRSGDVYGFMVEHYAKNKNLQVVRLQSQYPIPLFNLEDPTGWFTGFHAQSFSFVCVG